MDAKLSAAGSGDKQQPLLPPPTPSTAPTHSSRRPTSTLLRVALASLALVALYLQYGPAIELTAFHSGPAYPRDAEAAYARRLANVDSDGHSQSLFAPSHRHHPAQRPPLSKQVIRETLLSVPDPASAKNASKA